MYRRYVRGGVVALALAVSVSACNQAAPAAGARYESTPAPVVINEALELARTFSTEEAVKFINGMLDTIRRKIEER